MADELKLNPQTDRYHLASLDGTPHELIIGPIPNYNDIWQADSRRTFVDVMPEALPALLESVRQKKLSLLDNRPQAPPSREKMMGNTVKEYRERIKPLLEQNIVGLANVNIRKQIATENIYVGHVGLESRADVEEHYRAALGALETLNDPAAISPELTREILNEIDQHFEQLDRLLANNPDYQAQMRKQAGAAE